MKSENEFPRWEGDWHRDETTPTGRTPASSTTCDEILSILSRCWDEQATADDFQRLNALLKSDASARQVYIQLVTIDRRLRLRYAPASLRPQKLNGMASRRMRMDATSEVLAVTGAPDADVSPLHGSWRERLVADPGRRLALSLTASATVIALMLLTLNFISVRPHVAEQPGSTRQLASARIGRMHECRWGSGQRWRVTDALEPGTELDLVAGLVEVQHASGATLIVEGPALVEILGGNEAQLDRGQLTAHVPPGATGYRIQTSTAEIEDLGTEFGLLVEADGDLEVHVLTGRVQTHFRDTSGIQQTIPLNVTQGLRLTAENRTPMTIPSNAEAFVRMMPSSHESDSTTTRTLLTLIEPGAAAWAYVPQDLSIGERLKNEWYRADFVMDAAWKQGRTAVGYDTQNKEIADLVNLSVEEMFERQTSVWVRIPFELDASVSQVERLVMKLQFDDGFIAYLNGHQVAEFNAPQTRGIEATAVAARVEAQETERVEFDLTDYATVLTPGQNWLAIQGLNHSAKSTDLLVLPQLDAYLSPLSPLPSPPSE
jgi:ferric-dicitrate binding protein FerR (iron transport regulator)